MNKPHPIALSDGVVEIRLPWPEVRNALGPQEADALADALESAVQLTSTRVVLLTADGPSFCAGGNLRSVTALAQQGEGAVRESVYSAFQRIVRTITSAPFPVIAVVDGHAVGFGCDLALACDVRIAGPNATFRYGWADIGLISAAGGLLDLRTVLGGSVLWDFVAGTALDQTRAAQHGLAIASDNAYGLGQELAERLAVIERDVLAATKALIDIADRTQYLSTALDYQVGFITDPGFSARVDETMRRAKEARSAASAASVPRRRRASSQPWHADRPPAG